MSTVETPLIQKTPGVCGGDACIRRTRITVWMLVLDRRLGMTDEEIRQSFELPLSAADLDAAWRYYRENPVEIEQQIWFNDTAGNVPEGERPPVWVIVSGRVLGISDDEIRESFDPPLSVADIDTAWDEYRADMRRVGWDLVTHFHPR
jgi:uncharacterized protein (DUF433 family)